jgi:phosphoglycerate dehydrogenase-like enzyme
LPVPAWTSSTLSRLTLTTPFSNSTNVIVTPHALCWTDQMFERIGATDMQAVLDLSRGRVPAGIVNRAVLDNPIWQRRLARYAVS